MRLDRIESIQEILVDVIDCAVDPDLNDTSLAGETVDFSEMGMQVSTNMQIPVSTRVFLRLDVASNLYRLEGNVRWSRKEGSNYIGLLLDDESQDFKSWLEMFEYDFEPGLAG